MLRVGRTKAFGITSVMVTVPAFCADQIFTMTSVVNGTGVATLLETLVPSGTTVQYPFPSPLVSTPRAGGSVSIDASGTTNNCTAVSGVGIQK